MYFKFLRKKRKTFEYMISLAIQLNIILMQLAFGKKNVTETHCQVYMVEKRLRFSVFVKVKIEKCKE